MAGFWSYMFGSWGLQSASLTVSIASEAANAPSPELIAGGVVAATLTVAAGWLSVNLGRFAVGVRPQSASSANSVDTSPRVEP